MIRFSLLFSSLFVFNMASSGFAADNADVGYRPDGVPRPTGGGLCDEGDPYLSQFNADATYENAYAWQYGGIVVPDYGAFAEFYPDAPFDLFTCSVLLDLTQTTSRPGTLVDVYVWDEYDGVPGLVIGTSIGVDPGAVGTWPEVSRHAIGMFACPYGAAFVGFWGNWPGEEAAYFVGADLDGPGGGGAFTNYAPGIGFPTGWNTVDAAWGPTQALGIGWEFDTYCDRIGGVCCLPDGTCVETYDEFDCESDGGTYIVDALCSEDPCSVSPVIDTSWGKIKRLYDQP